MTCGGASVPLETLTITSARSEEGETKQAARGERGRKFQSEIQSLEIPVIDDPQLSQMGK
jgi:hypothetical protein